MGSIRVVLDGELLRATDPAARRVGRSRSALIRGALREHLDRLDVRDREERDRRGYERVPESAEDPAGRGRMAEWRDD